MTENTETKDIKLSDAAQKILEAVEKLTVIELADLVKAMEDKFGVSAAAPAAVAAAPAAGGEEEAEKDSFDVELTSAGGQKIAAIKAVKEITGLGLADAKALVDGAPKMIKEGVKKAEAEEMKKKVEESGATVTLK